MAIPTFTATGTKATSSVKLPKEVFGVEIKNHQLLKDAYLAYQANTRPNLAKTLKRGEVRGGGAKPWRQKGTGRARFGSSRNPIWRSGGVAFGPQGNENYSRKINVKAKRQALRQALTLAAQNDKLIVIEAFKTKGKIKDTVSLLKKLGAERKVLITVNARDDLVNQATNNLPNVKAIFVKNLNVCDLLDFDRIVISKKSLDIIKEWLGGDK